MKSRSLALALIFLASRVSVIPAEDRKLLRKDFLGNRPPEIISEKDDWIAAEPTTLAAMRAKVVWLQFNF